MIDFRELDEKADLVFLDRYRDEYGSSCYGTSDGYHVEPITGSRQRWAVNGPRMFRTSYAHNLQGARRIIAMARQGELEPRP